MSLMHKKKKQRIMAITLVLLGVGTAVALSLTALNQTVTFFYSPSDLAENTFVPPVSGDRPFRLGGLVETGSIEKKGLVTTFIVTDGAHSLSVHYEGILPDLFKEGQGVVALGRIDENKVFIASELLAKHDENYMSPEVKKALEDAGHPVE